MKINVLEYLEQTADHFPAKVALRDDKNSVTFGQWLAQAQSIGTALSKAINGDVRKPVLVFVDRCIEGLIGFMGVVESGNFYVPIDCKMPAERIRLIAGVLHPVAAVIFTEADEKALDSIGFSGVRLVYSRIKDFEHNYETLERIRKGMIDMDPLYAIFTSGSTGIPKGVVISHRGVIDLAEWLVSTFGFTNDDSLGNQTPFYFDGSVKDIYITLKTGATLNVIGKKYFSFPKLLVNFLNERQITSILWATSAMVLVGNSNILSENKPEYINKVFFAGEAMPAKQLKVWQRQLPKAMYVNLYGPTEITVDCTYYVVDHEFADDEFIPIGRECRNMQVLVFNDENQLVKPSESGELCVRGTGVALGYYGNRLKTEEVFVQNPLNDKYEDKIYRTGDIVRYNPEGVLEFVSRKDSQIKHMGNRIELGEIEVAVNSLPEVTNAACIYDHENSKIVLFYTSSSTQDPDIINGVKTKLPKYMFPNYVSRVEEMPYSLNGKIDRLELKKIYATNKD